MQENICMFSIALEWR